MHSDMNKNDLKGITLTGKIGSWLSGMKNIGSNRVDSDSNTLKWVFLDSNWLEQTDLG